MNEVVITSDGTAQGTKVSIGGRNVEGLLKVVVNPISPGVMVTAQITVNVNYLKMVVGDLDLNLIELDGGCDAEDVAALLKDMLFKQDK
ncbi:MAG: hypothetical protein JKX87_06235 [Cycloclasticus sp.]|nr:hypothetical protein [Cycloclasticus sp.]